MCLDLRTVFYALIFTLLYFCCFRLSPTEKINYLNQLFGKNNNLDNSNIFDSEDEESRMTGAAHHSLAIEGSDNENNGKYIYTGWQKWVNKSSISDKHLQITK